MPDDPRVDRLLERLLEERTTPEEVCGESPELLPEVRERWQRVRALHADLDALFPATGDGAAPSPAAVAIPRIPGYEVEGVLGRGGMGIVYRARQLRLNRTVALKVLVVGAYATPQEIARFEREAEVVAALQHPNIVRVFDSGRCQGWPYIVMEFVEGGTLADKLATTRLDARAAAKLIGTLAGAVHSAHECGIVHRDLKPGNVLLAADGTPRIADFGLSRRLDRTAPLTISGTALGTPSYMAPEQALGAADRVGPAADIYSLGATLYELLAGRPPFDGDTPAATQRQLLTLEPQPPSRWHANVPRDLETICLKCLQRDPRRRFATAADLAVDLGRFLRHEPIRARPVGPAERAVRWARRSPAGAALLLLASLLLLLGAGTVLQDKVLAAELATRSAPWRPRLDEALALLRGGQDLRQVQDLLEQIPGDLAPELRQLRDHAQRDVVFAGKLDGIRLDRAAVTGGRLDPQGNRARADDAYAELFGSVGIRAAAEAAEATAARVRESGISLLLVAALDDWALCAGDPARRDWILRVARLADPDPDGWRDRVRDESVRDDAARLQQLAADAPLAGQSVQILVSLGERLADAGVDAVPFLSKVQRLHPGDFWVNFLLGDILIRRQSPEAIRYLQAALALRPRSPAVHLGLGRALHYAGKAADALAAFETARQLAPGYAQALMSLGTARANLKLDDRALADLEQAARLEPTSSGARRNLGAVLTRKGMFERAIVELHEAIRLAPGDVSSHVELAAALRGVHRTQEAVAEYQQALQLDPRSARAHGSYGDLLRNEGRFGDAVAEFRAAVRLTPDDPWAQLGLGLCLLRCGRVEESLAPSARAVELQPDANWNRNIYGECLLRAGRPAAAAEQFLASLARDPDDGAAGWHLPVALVQLGRDDEAWSVSAHACAARPADLEYAESHAILGLYLGREDEWRRASAQLFERFADSDDPRVWERAGRCNLLLPPAPEVLQRATGWIDRAVAADPARHPTWAKPYFVFASALADYRAGAFAAAIRSLRGDAAGVLGPAPRLLLAMALQRSGDAAAARQTLATAALDFDWSPRKTTRDDWLYHALRREAEATVLPGLPALLAGGGLPSDDDTRAILLGACRATCRDAMAAQLWATVLAGDAERHAGPSSRRYLAACAAAAAADGDVASLGVDGPAEYRRWALQWLAAELDGLQTALADASPDRLQRMADTLDAWHIDPDLDGLRDPARQRQLPVDERVACAALWERIAALQADIAARRKRSG